jgi:hypothetical protein
MPGGGPAEVWPWRDVERWLRERFDWLPSELDGALAAQRQEPAAEITPAKPQGDRMASHWSAAA